MTLVTQMMWGLRPFSRLVIQVLSPGREGIPVSDALEEEDPMVASMALMRGSLISMYNYLQAGKHLRVLERHLSPEEHGMWTAAYLVRIRMASRVQTAHSCLTLVLAAMAAE